jgi:hypothetical protein
MSDVWRTMKGNQPEFYSPRTLGEPNHYQVKADKPWTWVSKSFLAATLAWKIHESTSLWVIVLEIGDG